MGTDINVEVVYAQADAVWRTALTLPAGTTVGQALDASGFALSHPAYPQEALAVGIHGQVCTPERILGQGDRIEIYRPLSFDPMESRRRRAQHRKAFMTKRLSRT